MFIVSGATARGRLQLTTAVERGKVRVPAPAESLQQSHQNILVPGHHQQLLVKRDLCAHAAPQAVSPILDALAGRAIARDGAPTFF